MMDVTIVNGTQDELVAYVHNDLTQDDTVIDCERRWGECLTQFENAYVDAMVNSSIGAPCPIHDSYLDMATERNVAWVSSKRNLSIAFTKASRDFISAFLSNAASDWLKNVLSKNMSQGYDLVVSALMALLSVAQNNVHKLTSDQKYVYCLSISYCHDYRKKTFDSSSIYSYNARLIAENSMLANGLRVQELTTETIKQEFMKLEEYGLIREIGQSYEHVF